MPGREAAEALLPPTLPAATAARLSPASQPTSPPRVLAVALLCQTLAGVLYWWPALMPELQAYLGLSSKQALVLLATANSGDTLAILSGLFHARFGSRATCLLGALGLTVCFAAFVLLRYAPTPTVFPLAFLITVVVIPSSFAVYATALSLPAAVFPQQLRGRVFALLTACYAASGAMFTSFQNAFFQNPVPLLSFSAAYALFIFIIVALVFPNGDHFTLHHTAADAAPRVNAAHRVVSFLVITLQFAAVAAALSASEPVRMTFAVLFALALGMILLTPLLAGPELPTYAASSSECVTGSSSLREVVTDERFHYLALTKLLLAGGGSITVLVQARAIMGSRLALTDADSIPAAVRTLVIVFSAFNVSSRLLLGRIMDYGQTALERHISKYRILHTSIFVMAVALIAVSIAPTWCIYVAIALVGACQGAFYGCAPALCSLWFGVSKFPRNFSALGPFQLLASVTLSSTVPEVLMERFGSWVSVNVDGTKTRICVGRMCTVPTFVLIAALQVALYIWGWRLYASLGKSWTIDDRLARFTDSNGDSRRDGGDAER